MKTGLSIEEDDWEIQHRKQTWACVTVETKDGKTHHATMLDVPMFTEQYSSLLSTFFWQTLLCKAYKIVIGYHAATSCTNILFAA